MTSTWLRCEYGFGLVLKTSLSRGGALMEEQMLLFPLPVESCILSLSGK